ncbi:hypothetical protein BsWGS_06182 [Bradybaena similaris]
MAAQLEDLLLSLHSLCKKRQSNDREQIEVTVEDIKQICAYETTDKDSDYICSQLFDKEHGITNFLRCSANSEELQNAKTTALNLLSELLQKMGKKMLPYAVDVKEACMSVYILDRFAKVKNAAIPVLIKLLELTVGSSVGDDLKIESMITKFFTELTKASKLTASVKAGIYHILGVIAEVYPDVMTPYAEKLVRLYVTTLSAEMDSKAKKVEQSIIAGCLEGLTAFLLNFTQSAEEGSKYSYEIFKYARKAIDPNTNLAKYEVPKAGLKLFARHAGQFRQYLMDEYVSMYKKLQHWSQHKNREVLHLGVLAMEAFIKEVSEELVERAQQGRKHGAVFKFFLLEFRDIMHNKSTPKQVALAIRGYGLLAAPCKSFLKESDTQFMFGEMVHECEHQFFGQVEDIDEKLMSIPSYLTALSNIIRQLDSVAAPHALVLEKLVVLLIENIPQVNEKMHYPCFKSILQLLLSLMEKAMVFQQVLSSVVYQGLIRTCSHPIVAETAQLEDTESDTRVKKVSYKDFIPLWSKLLESCQMRDLAAENFTLAERKHLTEILYNELMTAILKVLSKLDFEATVPTETDEDGFEATEEKENLSADPVFGVTAKRPKDFQVFINIVDFCRDLLVSNHWRLFSRWVYTYTHTLIVMSTRHPLVSGFYKLLAVTMTLANKLNFFKSCSKDQPLASPSNDEQMEVDEEDADDNGTEKNAAYQLIKKFSKEVLVRMKQYRDDLLASCLTLILSLPKEVIADQMTDIIPAIKTTFTIGLSYLPLANVGLSALEYWCQHLPASVLEPYYSEFLPCLDAYLKTDNRGSDEVASDQLVVVTSKKSSRKSRVPVRLLKEQRPAVEAGAQSQLSMIKYRILRYLGSLGGQINHNLLAHTEEEISQEAIAWDTQKHLRFDVPFYDMKPVIYFDPFLPQVVKLAQQSSDRQTKVAACELLHSLVLYALGRGAQMPGETQKKYPMEQLYRRLFPPLLALACDVEQVCKDLFEPLVMQLIHWFTNNKMAESPETMALLDSIFDGLIQANDTALRDFSARCLREFLHWSLKQMPKKAADKNPINAKSVLKRIHSYSLHPSAFKRLGAALAFNNIYMVFREEDALVDRFTFEILVHFVESLSLAHKDDKAMGTQEQCVKVLEHLERIIIKKADLLKKDPGAKLRPEPSFWSSRKLDIAVRWLTRQCGNPQTECRHACMKLVFKLCTLLPGVKSAQDFFKIIHKDQGPIYFLQRFEGGGSASGESQGLLACPTLDKLTEPFSVAAARQWFDMLLAALDCYCWAFAEGLMTPLQLFTGKGSEKSCIFQSVSFCLEKLVFSDIEGAARLLPHKDTVIFTPLERDDYNRIKCTVIIRIWNFLSVMLERHSQEVSKVVPSHVWCENLWKLLSDCVVRPGVAGFNMADTEIMVQLPKEMNHVLHVLTKFLPAPQMKQLKSSLTRYLLEDCNLVALLPINLASGTEDYPHLTQIVEGHRQLHSAKLLIEHLPGGHEYSLAQKLLDNGPGVYKDSLAQKLFDNVFEGIVKQEGAELTSVTLSPPAHNLAKSLILLALDLGLSKEILLNKIMEKKEVRSLCRGSKSSHGDMFFTMFSTPLASHIAHSGLDFLSVVMDKAKIDQQCVSAVLIAVLEHVSKDRSMRKKEGVNLCGEILNQWTKLSSWWGDEATQQSQSLALLLLTKLLLIDSKCVCDPSSQTFEPVFEMYKSMLKDNKTTMSFKHQVLELLPFFATLKGSHQDELKDAVNRFIADNFPLRSSEFSEGSHQNKDYIAAINKLLGAMEMTGSLMLLEIIISILCRESKHSHEDAIQQGITNLITRLPSGQQKPAADIPYAIFTQEETFQPEIRRASIERVCLPILRLASNGTVIEFFMDHIHELVRLLDVKLNTSTESVLESQLVTKLCCFQMLELMYARLSKDEVNSQTSAINQRFCFGKADTGKEMTQKITKAAHDAKSEDTRGENLLVGLRRQYHCYAYNLLISIISCVQTDIKFYKGFLFQDNVAKGQFLVDNIIDKDQAYEFPVELQAPLERRRKFVSIRNEIREKRGEVSGNISWDISSTSSLHQASQYLADSSLCEDLNQYDFNLSTTSQQAGAFTSRSKKSASHLNSDDAPVPEVSITENYIELEMDALNQHESMAPLIALIRHMMVSNICPQVPKGVIPKEMPAWMLYLHEKMTNPESHINVKLFIAKLVINCNEIFHPYAQFWLRPLCQLFFSTEVSGRGITYFAVDLLVTMITWHNVAIPENSAEERAMASRVVKILMINIHHPTRQVFRNNLELLKTVLECWHDRVEIPYDVIYSLLKPADPKSDKNAGVQVLGLVVAGRFPPYGPSAPVSYERYMQTLVDMMKHNLKTVFVAAAEVVGLIFHHMADVKEQTSGWFHDMVVSELTGLANTRVDNFINCVHSIHKCHPPVTERFVSKLLFILPSLHGRFRAQCLEVIQGHVDGLENAFVELNSKGLAQFLTHRDEDTQLVSLKIFKSMMSKLQKSELLSLLPSVTDFSKRTSQACRIYMLDVLMWTYDNYRDGDDDISAQIMRLTKEALLKGLCDEDQACRLVCQNFWSSNTRLPVGTLDRTVSMLEAMYSPTTEPHYLAYATDLLLEATSKSPDYQREIFEHALSECKFQDYSVHSSWRQRHAVMTPLFASTLVTQSMDTSEGEDNLDGHLRATQDAAQFTATVDMAGSGKAFNWLTQSSLDTFAETGTIGGDSQLLINRDRGQSSVKSRNRGQPRTSGGHMLQAKKTLALKYGNAGESKPSTSGDGTDKLPESLTDVWRLKRRFVRDQHSQSVFYMKQNVRLRKMREEAQKEQKARRENQVTLYRKYRIGDLPDIQIKYQYVIAPLQALANRDSTVARLLFSSLFQAIFHEMDKVKTEREMKEIVQAINKSLESIMSQSVQFFPPFMGCILNILYELRSNLKVPASELGISAMKSNQQTLGIMVLEEQLIQSDPRQTSTAGKRAKLNVEERPVETTQWIELAYLYKSVHEFDVLQGIFGDKLGTKQLTREAILAEARGDYNAAFRKYNDALCVTEWNDGDPLEAEVTFWNDNRMECVNNLCQWGDLETISVEGVDSAKTPNLDRVWEDEYYQEHFLPYVVRSKLKLLLRGADQQSLLSFIDSSMVNESTKQHLQSRYSTELALMYLWQQNYDKSRHYTSMAFESLLQDWRSTTTLLEFCRRSTLQQVQALVELQEFLDNIGHDKNVSESRLSHLMTLWSGRLPHQLLDPMTIWDNVITNRTVYLQQLQQVVIDPAEVSDPQSQSYKTIQTIDEMKVWLRLAMADSCQKQNNFTLALKLLKDTKGCKKMKNQQPYVEWVHLYAGVHHSKAELSPSPWESSTFNNVMTTLDLLDKQTDNSVLREMPDLGLRHHVLTGRGLNALARGLLDIDNLHDIENGTKSKLASHAGLKTDHLHVDELIGCLMSKSFTSLKAAVGWDIDERAAHRKSVMTTGEANLELAKFCDKYLHMKEDAELPDTCNVSEFPQTVVICLLKAMQEGQTEARERFPRLLQIAELYPEVIGDFNRKAAEIPSWMFLLWVSQMTALLDKKEVVVVGPLLMRIAEEYPQALIYAFRMSSEGFNFESSSSELENSKLVDKLSQKIDNPLVNKLINALEQFGQPDMIIKDWCIDMKKLFSTGANSKNEIMRKYTEIYNDLFNVKASASDAQGTQTSASSTSASVDMGDYRKRFALVFKTVFDNLFGNNGKKLADMNQKAFNAAYDKIMNLLKQETKNGGKLPVNAPVKLKDYCPWLAAFNPNKNGRDLEIPGQYDGLQKPLPEYHVKIAGFDERVLVMSSLRKPKRIKIRGNDEKEYPYLVKSGEDLRLDQRIEVLFFLMNKVMSSDPACRRRKLHLKTYKVISMTPRVGLIEWMENTQPVKEFFMDALTDDERKYIHSNPREQHLNWATKLVAKDDKQNMPLVYDAVFKKYSLTETVKEFRQLEGKVPWDLSRRAIKKISSSPEAFHVLRTAMITSHAVICVCQYLLGIGDRHLSNSMVSLKTGHLVGIDFGHAFGTATQFLLVPELVPFRLTRQFVNLNMPLQVNGQMESTMRNVLRALRDDSDLLLSTMDVFVKEPSLDWLKFAESQIKAGNMAEDADREGHFYPKEKIKIARRKLKGEHPSYIMKEELRLGHEKNQAFDSRVCVLVGDKNSIRAKLPDKSLAVEQQVAALIDLATDPNILGRMWAGWEPWV